MSNTERATPSPHHPHRGGVAPGLAAHRRGAASPGRPSAHASQAEGRPAIPHVITVYGDPKTQGSKRRGADGHMFEATRGLAGWRATLHAAATAAIAADPPPADGPLIVEVTFTLRKPVRAPKKITTWPYRRSRWSGDIDKLQRAVFDALSNAGVWVDDSRVVEVTARKVYPGEGIDALDAPGVVIRIWPVNP